MKRLIRNMAAGGLVLAAALASCTDEEWTAKPDVPFLTDREGHMVEVELPFSLSQSMTTTVVTRAGGEEVQVEDASLSGIHLAIFKDSESDDPEQDELILWKLYNRKDDSNGEGSGFWEDTGHEHATSNDGILRFYAPVGKVYIYLLANAKGTLLDFYKGPDGSYVTDGELINIKNRADFFNIVQPKWKGGLVPTDGILPMSGMVNNKDGKCLIGIPTTGRAEEGSDKGSIWYQQDGQVEWTEISPDIEDEDHTFMLRRMVSKVTFNIKTPESTDGAAIKFTPRNYTFRHVAQYVPAAPNTIPGEYWPDEMRNIPVVDSETRIFGTQSPNSFTVYLPENMRGHSRERNEEGKFTYAMRDKVVKDVNHQNTFETAGDIPGGSERLDDHKEHYKFQYALPGSTYVEITGHYEKLSDGKVTESGDTKYIIHLGDFSDKEILDKGDGYNSFNLARDHHYTYTVTIKGIDDIETEVKSGDKAEEPNPGVEGIIFQEGAQLRLDAHYETVEMLFNRDAMLVADPTNLNGGKVPGIYIYTETPFGDVFGTYVFPQDNETQGKFYNQQGIGQDREAMESYFEWVSFRKQEAGGKLAPYYDGGDPISVFDALDEFWTNARSASSGYTEYYTCFVDEYYYTSDPRDPARIPQINEFVNKPDRTFSLASDVRYSADGKSGIASAVYVLKQRSIATFYDIDSPVSGLDYIYGLETVDELEGSDIKLESYGGDGNGNGSPESIGIGEGYGNTKTDLGISNGGSTAAGLVDWTQNGYLLNESGEAYMPKPADRLKFQEGRYACLTRNRDFNGDGRIDGDELRWYTPSLNQVLGIWVGESGLPSSESALYTKDTQSLNTSADYGNYSQYPIFTSSEKNGRVVWGEEGCSFGPNYQAEKVGARVRAVRTLSAKEAATEDYKEEPQPFYTYNDGDRTFTLHLNNTALRLAAVERELAPHHERDVNVNRPYRKFQIAKRPYVVMAKAEGSCRGDTHTVDYCQLQTDDATTAKTKGTSLSGYRDPGQETVRWRLPNQRELALMVMEWDRLKTYQTEDLEDNIKGKECNIMQKTVECTAGLIHWRHDWTESDRTNNYLHCRTSFSNSRFFGNHQGEESGWFRPYGYIYNIEEGIITMSVGYDADGTAGYLGVRDVK